MEYTDKIKYFCDKCDAEIRRNKFSKDVYKAIFQEGSSYPEGGMWEAEEAYFCKGCADGIKKLLEDNGVKFIHEEYDW